MERVTSEYLTYDAANVTSKNNKPYLTDEDKKPQESPINKFRQQLTPSRRDEESESPRRTSTKKQYLNIFSQAFKEARSTPKEDPKEDPKIEVEK